MLKIGNTVLALFIAVLCFNCSVEVDESPQVDSDVVKNHLADTTVLIVDGEVSEAFIVDVGNHFNENEVLVRLELRLQDGGIEVLGEQVTAGLVNIPALLSVQGATVDVYLEESLFGGIDVYTTAVLPRIPEGLEDSVLFQGRTFMVVDMSKIDGSGAELVSGTTMTEFNVSSYDGVGIVRQALSNCGNNVWGPGVGRFLSSSPGPYGQRYSYCPESTPTLNWAAQGDFGIDALYNQYWGCTQAIKVPNNCTYTVDASNNRSYCCGFPFYQPSIINPSTDPYFPDCPLSN
jgi:hypothetical protein